MKKKIALLLLVTMVVSLAACGKTSVPEGKTLGGVMADKFNSDINSNDVHAVAKSIGKMSGVNCDVIDYDNSEDRYFMGFKNKSIQKEDYTSCVCVTPAIGSVAFIAYIFEVEGDAAAFENKLAANADPAWNICVIADETVHCTNGKYVFFAMCPSK